LQLCQRYYENNILLGATTTSTGYFTMQSAFVSKRISNATVTSAGSYVVLNQGLSTITLGNAGALSASTRYSDTLIISAEL
jgi:hypothetical protein